VRNRFYLASLFTFLIVYAITSPAMGAVINVGGPTGLPTIQAGINAAVDGDTVLVANGTYSGAGNRNIDFGGKLITLTSQGDPTKCIIDGGKAARGFIFSTKETRLAKVIGFTIRNCDGKAAGGLGGDGGAFLINEASPVISRCIIKSNSASSGGAMRITGSRAVISNCLFVSNTATQRGGAISLKPQASNPTFLNCTMTGNTAPASGGGAISSELLLGKGVKATVTNCILWGNSAPEIKGVIIGGVTTVVVTFSDVKQKIVGKGNIGIAPGFVSDTNPRLKPTSACIDAGSNAAAAKPVDLGGNRRIRDGNGDGIATVDMGAFELQ